MCSVFGAFYAQLIVMCDDFRGAGGIREIAVDGGSVVGYVTVLEQGVDPVGMDFYVFQITEIVPDS